MTAPPPHPYPASGPLRQLDDLKLAAENFRRAMIQSGATSHVKQSLYMEQLRALECALSPLNYRDDVSEPDIEELADVAESILVPEIERMRAALLEVRKIANGEGNPRTIIAKIFDIATQGSRGEYRPVAQCTQVPVAAALARRLCQMFDSGGESQRSARARHASAIFQILNKDAPEYAAEQAKCDADPAGYLRAAEGAALPSTEGK